MLAYFGLDAMGAVRHRDAEAINGGEGVCTPEEILDYCEGDVELSPDVVAMLPGIASTGRARGRFMSCRYREHAGKAD
jgi:hypothetical protein